MRAVISSGIATVAILGGCQRVDWERTMHSHAGMPNCSGAKVEHIRQEMTGLDASNTIAVTATAGCMENWRKALGKSDQFYCRNRPLTCLRQIVEWEYVIVTFDRPNRALVELSEI